MLYRAQGAVRAIEHLKSNRFLAALPPDDLAVLDPHLRTVPLERGVILQEAGGDIEQVYFPHSGMVSLVAVMESGATVETATVGRNGIIGATAALGSRSAFGRAVVQLPGTAARMPAAQFCAAARESIAIRNLAVRYNDFLIAQIQQSVACNALHSLEARLCRWLLQTHDCVDGGMVPLTQELLAQMLGVRRTTVTIAARLLQSAGAIRYRRGLVQIVDRPALEKATCECYGTMRRNLDKTLRPSPIYPARYSRSRQGESLGAF
jgi:CRP-like cAMP-binding protein